jgi:hypothetical protein
MLFQQHKKHCKNGQFLKIKSIQLTVLYRQYSIIDIKQDTNDIRKKFSPVHNIESYLSIW